MAREAKESSSLSEELKNKLKQLHCALNDLKQCLTPLTDDQYSKLKEKAKDNPLDMAIIDITMAYSINSLFWMYLITNGVDPQQHSIKRELERLKALMLRLKEIKDKSKAPKLDVIASKRFIRNALWQANDEPNESDSKRKNKRQKCNE
ncbi:sun-cor steroid hormone receptor co-repressor-like protein [Dinothrombium tinctorium]|uniref:Nuclear nucleic acid-binding protein C1D n=1 Tax=Dinothrombium tinctorium TaxID=1965070 RepID=A0A443QPI0_9ACAR|nr:sun-cor steroid hormone receptor co-repressor-like protein [Dinothrombium tinctorium]